MIRRIACLLLVPVLFANQLWACCAHSHEGQSASTPHIHLNWDADGHSNGHHHSHHHGHSHDAPHSHHSPTNNSSDQHDSDLNLKQDSLSDQHEDALLYCTNCNYLTQSESSRILDFCQSTVSCKLPAITASTPEPLANATIVDARARYRCAIFLQTRSLRL